MVKTRLRRFWGSLSSRRRGKGAACAVDILDLLGRPAVNLTTPELQRFLAGKRVLVTGAGGSIGSEICRQSLKFCPSRLVLLDQAENALFEVDRELNHRWVGANIAPIVADIVDERRIASVFAAEKPQVIFHCAAHKHVPMMELHPGEAIKNNVIGTKIVADAAAHIGAAAFVMVSTDKAVNPTSVMGAAKRCAELYVQSLNVSGARTRFVAVRFGNVLGSSGSVVPIFRKQIEAGGPVTVTHPEMRRFFMTIPEEMIRRSGLRPGDDIAIEFTGIRPGEKLSEELAGQNEQTRPTNHKKIRIWQLPHASVEAAMEMVDRLSAVVHGSREQILSALAREVPEYRCKFPAQKVHPTFEMPLAKAA